MKGPDMEQGVKTVQEEKQRWLSDKRAKGCNPGTANIIQPALSELKDSVWSEAGARPRAGW